MFDHLRTVLESPAFQTLHKSRPQDFTRRCFLGFSTLFCFIANLRHCSATKELKAFCHSLTGDREPAVTASAFHHARHKLKPSAFRGLLHEACGFVYRERCDLETWYDFRLCAVDGSDLQLPDIDVLRAHFDPKTDPAAVPMARLSTCFDVLNGIPLDMYLSPMTTGERDCLVQHLDSIGPGDLLLTDMGYAAHWVFAMLAQRDIRFCFRAKPDFNGKTAAFVASGCREQVVTLQPNDLSVEKAKEHTFEANPVTVRLIRVDLQDGTVEVLVTDLLDPVQWPCDVFGPLYALRWPIETEYDHTKQWGEIECFSGKHVDAILQDVYAKVFAVALTAMVALDAHPQVERQTKSRKLDYQINWSDALAAMRHWGMLLLLRVRGLRKELASLLESFVSNPSPIRPGRRFQRKKRVTPRKYAITRQAIS